MTQFALSDLPNLLLDGEALSVGFGRNELARRFREARHFVSRVSVERQAALETVAKLRSATDEEFVAHADELVGTLQRFCSL